MDGTIDVNWKYATLGPQSHAVRSLLEKYGGTVVYFSGHIHRGLMTEPGGTIARMNGVTYVSTPSVCHPDRQHYKADNEDVGTGFLVDLNGSAVRIRGYNFAYGNFLTNFDWSV